MSALVKPTLNPNLIDFWRTQARNRVLYGGRGSSKSWDAAGVAIARAQFTRTRFLCVRQFQNKISESVYTLLKIQIERFELSAEFVITDRAIRHKTTGSEFLFYGLWRQIDEVKSLEGIDVLWIEEGRFLTKEQYDILEPTVRKAGSEIWLIFNPYLVTDFVWRNFVLNPPPETVVRKINYDENPFCSETFLRLVEHKRKTVPDEYTHIYLGEPKLDDEKAIIKRTWVMASIDAHLKLGIKPAGQVRIGYDVADSGQDLNAAVTAFGFLCLNVKGWSGQKDDLLGSCARVYNMARRVQAHIYYDAIGVGAAGGSKFRELNAANGTRVPYTAFIAGGEVHNPDGIYRQSEGTGEQLITNRDHFANRKAQAWFSVADRFRNTYAAIHYGDKFDQDDLISINSGCENLDKLIDELCTPKSELSHTARVKVQSKKDLDIRSPNFADAFIMAYNPVLESYTDFGDVL